MHLKQHKPLPKGQLGLMVVWLECLLIGKNHGAGPGDILGAISGESGISGDLIGVIDMYDKFTFVEVPEQVADGYYIL